MEISKITLDPCDSLPAEMFAGILECLTQEDLMSCSLVSSSWRAASFNDNIWSGLCDKLWHDKVYVPESIVAMKKIDPREAYFRSIKDSTRDTITEEELLSFDWEFRFKEHRGAWYADADPWHHGRAPSHHKYMKDGMVKITGEYSGYAPDRRRWRWMDNATDRDKGSWVQICHYPSYKVFRTKNWGWMQQSDLALLVSFPMPSKGVSEELEDNNLPQIPDRYNWGRGGMHFDASEENPLTLSLLHLLLRRVGHLPPGFLMEQED